jgi:hypothetical protein
MNINSNVNNNMNPVKVCEHVYVDAHQYVHEHENI